MVDEKTFPCPSKTKNWIAFKYQWKGGEANEKVAPYFLPQVRHDSFYQLLFDCSSKDIERGKLACS